MFDWVGLRPGRETLRLETEKLNLKGKSLVVSNQNLVKIKTFQA